MLFRRIVWLIALYLALDVANPAMPGAVQLVDGALEIVAACPVRAVAAPTDSSTGMARRPSATALRAAPPEPPRPIDTVPLVVRPADTRLEPRSSLPSPVDDD